MGEVHVFLSFAQFQNFQRQVLNVPDAFLIKVEKALRKERIPVEAIRVYLPEFMKEINSTVERGEAPVLLIKRTVREKTNKPEVEIVFIGTIKERHVEDIRYARSDPRRWKSWGLIVLTLEQAKKFHEFLEKILAD